MPNSSFNKRHNTQNILEQKVKEWLTPYDREKSHQLLLIRRYLRQFGLMDIISESEIFNEAYIRVKKQVDSGREIANLSAWFNKICLNIVRERKREQKRIEQLAQKSSSTADTTYEPSSPLISELFCEEDFSRINAIIQEMLISGDLDNQCSLEIINLRFINEMKWKEVGDILVMKGFYQKNDKALQERLRQKGARLLKGLRKEFLSAASGRERHA